VISECGDYRYALWRKWDERLPTVLFVGLNPSTADDTHDDPTVRRCIGFAKRWGYGSLALANLFALRATDPRQLRCVSDPVGPDNDRWLHALSDEANLRIVAWGAAPIARARGATILPRLGEVFALGTTAGGEPRHPLYIAAAQQVAEYRLPNYRAHELPPPD
jgi:hypothetical protein